MGFFHRDDVDTSCSDGDIRSFCGMGAKRYCCEISWKDIRKKFKADLKGNYAYLSFIDGGVLRRDCRAINRGFNAVIEATVHATRYVLNRREDLLDKIKYYGGIIDRCGGKREREAYKLLMGYLKSFKAER